MITDLVAYSLRRAVAGLELNGELGLLSEPWKSMVEYLAGLDGKLRVVAWEAMMTARPDWQELVMAMANQNPDAPSPQGNPLSYATMADVARTVSAQRWLWKQWNAESVINVLASDPGIGKTRFALDLARRLYHGLPWPDGQTSTLPAGTRTLWVQGDRNYAEMLQGLHDFGLPEDGVVLGSSPEEPFGSLDLDDPETLQNLETRIVDSGVALAVIDTVGMCTARNLSRAEEARLFFAPIMELSHRTNVTTLALTHLSANKEALGRRIVEKARVVLKMTQPDPINQPDRRRLWVDKTAVVKPPPLGITMGTHGNEYDLDPPAEPACDPSQPARFPGRLDACKAWLTVELTSGPARVGALRKAAEQAEYPTGTLYAASKALGVIEYHQEARKWWKLPHEADLDTPY